MTALPSTEDLARLAKAITPGPWRRNLENTVCNQIDGEHHAICTDQFCYAPEEQQDANAEAIALLPAFIRDVLDRREAEGWLGISTAPLTGERVLVWRPTIRGGKGHIGVAYWTSDEYAKNPRPFWLSVEGYICKTEDRAHPPTHWRPLPAPPTTPTTEASHDR